jgi:NhaA family Na+:H+ antiporter
MNIAGYRVVGPPPQCNRTRGRVAHFDNSPDTWPNARKGVRRILAPVERFLQIQAASGIVLMTAAAAAMIWANSPWRSVYEALWHVPLGIQIGTFSFERDFHFWINDGLMTIFFFVVGLEIRREIYAGELSEVRRAALPVAAAFGGMLAPAVIFLALNAGRESVSGWAIPMATDIAFAVGALALLGKRVTPAVRILLLALAVIDDVGAIVVIAFFYSSEIAVSGFVILALGIFAIFGLKIVGVRSPLAYVFPGVIVWLGAYLGGIHPTLAGVIVGLLTPARTGHGSSRSPAETLQHQLHGWVAFGIMPLFAFANAGVSVGKVSFDGDALWVFLGVTIGLAVGKPLGILAVSRLAVRAGAAALPRGVQWSHVSVVGIAGGIGFTMALFIAQLAFPAGPLLETAKLAVLCGSGLAGVLCVFAGLRFLKTGPLDFAPTEADAEASTTH